MSLDAGIFGRGGGEATVDPCVDTTWDGTDAQGRAVASGNYRFLVEADGRVKSTSLTLVR